MNATVRGKRLWRRYGTREDRRVHTSVLTLAEVASELARDGNPDPLDGALGLIATENRIHPVAAPHARHADRLHAALRRTAAHAGLVDALILAAARDVGTLLVSADRAFGREPHVRAS